MYMTNAYIQDPREYYTTYIYIYIYAYPCIYSRELYVERVYIGRHNYIYASPTSTYIKRSE